MSDAAKVESIDVLQGLKRALAKLVEELRGAMTEADSEITRTIQWVELDQQKYWKGQIRKRRQQVEEAAATLRRKQLRPTPSGRAPSTFDEARALARAKRGLAEAGEKLEKVRRWSRDLNREYLDYKALVVPLGRSADADIPRGTIALDNMIEALKSYVALSAPRGPRDQDERAGVSMDGESQSVARAVGDLGHAEPSKYLHLRQMTPPTDVCAQTELSEPTFNTWHRELLDVDLLPQRVGDLGLPLDQPSPDSLMVLSADSWEAPAIYLERLSPTSDHDSGWFIGTMDVPVSEPLHAVRVGQLVKMCPGVEAVLGLPVGCLVVLQQGKIKAVLDPQDQDRWSQDGH